MDFEKLLKKADIICGRTGVFSSFLNKLYPFSTENITGYINEFDLKDKSLLTVGSSLDQCYNAILYGCKDVTVLDVNPYVKYFFYLKTTALIILEYEDFIRFFKSERNTVNRIKPETGVFDLKTFKLLLPILMRLDKESGEFWHYLITKYDPITIRECFFLDDEYKLETIKKCDPYLANEKSYKELQNKIGDAYIRILNGDVRNYELRRGYDNIWLSNITSYLDGINSLCHLFMKHFLFLEKQGQLLLSYLYRTPKDNSYQAGRKEIYNLPKIMELFKEVDLRIHSFPAVAHYIDNRDANDSVLIYRKK